MLPSTTRKSTRITLSLPPYVLFYLLQFFVKLLLPSIGAGSTGRQCPRIWPVNTPGFGWRFSPLFCIFHYSPALATRSMSIGINFGSLVFTCRAECKVKTRFDTKSLKPSCMYYLLPHSSSTQLSVQLPPCIYNPGYPSQHGSLGRLPPRESGSKDERHPASGHCHCRDNVWTERSIECAFTFAHSFKHCPDGTPMSRHVRGHVHRLSYFSLPSPTSHEHRLWRV
jgi:hypothetical protein